jgi:iron complex outermembrane receptor protein
MIKGVFKKGRYLLSPVSIAVLCMVSNAYAAEEIEKIEVTGSLIKRAQTEALPVTVMKADEFASRGYTSLADVMMGLPQSVSQAPTNAGSGVNINLRGLGIQRTLVLLDGQRITNESTADGYVNLSIIPFSSLERVEVLNDGASSLYGSDAIGGVVNFITKKKFSGTSVTAQVNKPEMSGGGQNRSFSITTGAGDLNEDGWTWFATYDAKNQSRLALADRMAFVQGAYAAAGKTYSPTTGSNSSPGYSFPANVNGKLVGATAATTTSPAFATGCAAPYSTPGAGGCIANTTLNDTAIYARDDHAFFTKGTLKTSGHTYTVDYLFGQSTLNSIKAMPTDATSASQGITQAVIKQGSAYYPAGYTGDLKVQYAIPGDMANLQDTQRNQRVTLTDKSRFGEWDYKGTINVGIADRTLRAASGVVDGKLLNEGISSGIINPFGSQSAQGMAYLSSIDRTGTEMRYSRTTYTSINGVINREFSELELEGGNVGVALGASLAKDTFNDSKLQQAVTLVPGGAGFTFADASRTINSVFAEAELPVTKRLTINAAAREDMYSDVGSTLNPKLSFKFNQSQNLMFRGAISTGFRAPTLNERYGYSVAGANTTTTAKQNDPVLCPGGNPVAGFAKADVCQVNLPLRTGSNPNLNPEKSKTWTLGVVGQPTRNATLSADFWDITMTDQVGNYSQNLYFDRYSQYSQYFVRNADGTLKYINNTTMNLAATHMNGVDVTAAYAFDPSKYGNFRVSLDGTYINTADTSVVAGDPTTSSVGQFGLLSNAPANNNPTMLYRWRHNMRLVWENAEWGAMLGNTYFSQYRDVGGVKMIPAYSIYNFSVIYKGIKSTDITLGVNNVFNTMPGYTSNSSFAVPYVNTAGSPLGRSLLATVTHRF